LRFGRSIEARLGVEEPGYQVPDEPADVAREQPRGALGAIEIIGGLVFPLAGFIFAVMRFSDEEIGRGLACALIAVLGSAAWVIVLTI
jgi:hypothetical protein